MEELIKYCSEHNYQIGFNITDKKYVIDFIITRKNYHILCDLFRELEYIYLCDINPSIYYDHNTGIKISLTVRKETSLTVVQNFTTTVVRISSKAIFAAFALTLLNLVI